MGAASFAIKTVGPQLVARSLHANAACVLAWYPYAERSEGGALRPALYRCHPFERARALYCYTQYGTRDERKDTPIRSQQSIALCRASRVPRPFSCSAWMARCRRFMPRSSGLPAAVAASGSLSTAAATA